MRALGRLQMTGGRVLTMADWLEIWLATRAHARDKTLRGYSAHIRLHLVPHLGQVLLAELDVGHLDRAFTALLGQSHEGQHTWESRQTRHPWTSDEPSQPA